MSPYQAQIALAYWVESPRNPFPQDAIGLIAYSYSRPIGKVLGGRLDGCLALVTTDEGEFVARSVTSLHGNLA